MGSPSDEDYCKKIAKHCKELGLICQLRVTSAHKGTEETLQILAQYEGMWLILSDILTICNGEVVHLSIMP